MKIFEGLQFHDLDGMIKPTIHVDEFSSKMGDDADIVVISFWLRSKQAAKDLMKWFERGYDFVLDADVSPGEIKPNRYLVYVEMRRRRACADHIQTMLEDLSSLCEYTPDNWIMRYHKQRFPWSVENFQNSVPMDPDQYRAESQQDLNELRSAAGLDVKKIYETTKHTQLLQIQAGLR